MLAAILNQNERFTAGLSSPLCSLIGQFLQVTSMKAEPGWLLNDEVKARLLQGIFNEFIMLQQNPVIFDTNRHWPAYSQILNSMFSSIKWVFCIRDLGDVFASFERIFEQNPMQVSAIYGFQEGINVYDRYDILFSNSGIIGKSFRNLKQEFFSVNAKKYIFVRYESLCADPASVFRQLYEYIEEELFIHDFDSFKFEASEYDLRLGAPGLHSVSGPVRSPKEMSGIPPDLYIKAQNDNFWRIDKLNIQKAKVI